MGEGTVGRSAVGGRAADGRAVGRRAVGGRAVGAGAAVVAVLALVGGCKAVAVDTTAGASGRPGENASGD
uniref:hypothetical protein n=1 Tax=Streptomyces flavofungini TaxID=68200 RepID=UPI0034DDEDD2